MRAGRRAGRGVLAHESAVATARNDEPDRPQRLPGLAHRRRADAEFFGEVAHGGQAVTDGKAPRGDESPDSGSDPCRGAVLNLGCEHVGVSCLNSFWTTV